MSDMTFDNNYTHKFNCSFQIEYHSKCRNHIRIFAQRTGTLFDVQQLSIVEGRPTIQHL